MIVSNEPLLEAHDVSVRYGRSTVLEGVNFSILAGEIVTVVGPNGSGKSTMVRALIGALPVSAGYMNYEATKQTA
jgi:zinc transport system ATP-binding protein